MAGLVILYPKKKKKKKKEGRKEERKKEKQKKIKCMCILGTDVSGNTKKADCAD